MFPLFNMIRLSISLFKRSLLKGCLELGVGGGGVVLEYWLPILPIILLSIFIGTKAIHQKPL